jgi:phenylalanyl-tRNA synthetase beta chain
MKFSYRWLTTLVDLKDITAQQVADALNRTGIEVESIAPLVRATKITTGLVKQRTMIEGSDHLSKVLVDTGHHGERVIVCGAANIREGQKVLVALPGAVLPSITIQETVIKGVPSQGMVCALNELGLDPKFLTPAQLEGIEVLDVKTLVGNDQILEDLGLVDTIIDLKLLANRPDLWSLEGIAFEVAALFNRPLITQEKSEVNLGSKSDFVIDLQTPKTKQFSIRVLKGIAHASSPSWLKQRLIGSGIRPISFLVDIGNYVMLLTGQPLHMYDLNKLPSKSLTLSDQTERSFVALDQKTYPLQKGDIVITSGDQIMCLAGVMGAQHCAVDASSTDIAIEAAAFDPASIRKTANRLNLISDASLRFAKGINLSDFERVLNVVTALIASITSIKEVYQPVTVNRLPDLVNEVVWQPQAINQLLSTQFSEETMVDALKRFGIISTKHKDGMHASIPRHRQDITGVADLAEEVIRLLGFETIEHTPMPVIIQAGGYGEKQEKINLIKNFLSSQGLDEALTYSLIQSSLLNKFNLLGHQQPFVLKNPLSEERKHVRTDVLGSLIEVVQYNLARQVSEGKIFEISQIAHHQGEVLQLALVLFGEPSPRSAMHKRPHTFYDIKGLIDGMLALLGVEPSRYQWAVDKQMPSTLHPGRSASLIIQNQRIGMIGQLTPMIQDEYDLGKSPVFVAHIDLTSLLVLKTSALKVKPIPRFPSVTRDLAFYVSDALAFSTIIKTVKKAGKKMVHDVLLFDLFQGNQLPQGQVAMAIRIILLDEQKTLQEEEINQTISAIKSALVSDCQIQLRS